MTSGITEENLMERYHLGFGSEMGPKLIQFDWMEYTVFVLMLTVSALIGVFFGFIKKKGQDTVDGYLLGGKEMGLFPISISLVSSFISGITILGLPAEIYTFGTQYMISSISFFANGFITIFVFLPVFYKLQLISVYQYMEMRFNKVVRNLVSFLFTLSLLAYIPVVIYAPALALNQVSSVDVHTVCIVVSVVCIFYTTVGGLKAVVWTDTIQGLTMLLAVIVVCVAGTIKVGGLTQVIQAANQGERMEFFNMDLDPRVRTSFWSVFLGLTVHWTGAYSVSPSAIQRFIALKTLRQAKWSVFNFVTGSYIFFFISGYMGLVIYAQYKDCDLQASGRIDKPDQMLPYFILDVLGHIRGLPGLFLAGVVSAALSTLSAGINTVAGTIYEDFVEPVIGKTTDARAATIIKFIVVVFGFVCLLLVLVVEKLGSLVELSNSLGGLTSGTILGIFVLGMFFPPANSFGTTAASVVSLLVMGWILIGSRAAILAGEIVHLVKPVSIDSCPFNIIIGTNGTLLRRPQVFGKAFPLYEVSIFYYSLIGCSIVVIVGLAVSYLTGPTKVEQLNRDLLSPLIYRFLPTYSTVPTKETELVNL